MLNLRRHVLDNQKLIHQYQLIPLNTDYSIRQHWPWLRLCRGVWNIYVSETINNVMHTFKICSCDDRDEAINMVYLLRKQRQEFESQIKVVKHSAGISYD